MKKLLFFTLFAALGLGSCLDKDDTYERLKPVMPGLEIVQRARTQNHLAMQPANAAFRLGMLLAEAGDEEDLGSVMYAGGTVIGQLFDNLTTVEKVDAGYRITFRPDIVGADGYARSGSLLVKTNNVAQLADTDAGHFWEVIPEEFDMKTVTNGSLSTVHLTGGRSSRVWANGDGTYTVAAKNIIVGFDQADYASDWTAQFTVKPADASLKYSACAGKDYEVEGNAEGVSCFSFDGQSAVSLSYELTDATYRTITAIRTGTEAASLISSNYNTATFPAREVLIEWSVDGDNRRMQTIRYNGSVVTI
ncbi:hypothetical protein [Alistipes sp.]|uniref:hypothetical protein n=1 Tax=Alistipes sp. TaxID=1872444 RepID=UPI003AEFB4BB